MAAPRRVVELEIRADELARLETVARSRTEAASRVSRARIMLAYRAEPSSTAVGARLGVTHHTVQRCLRRAARLGVVAALDDSPRPGKAPDITPEARAWLVSLACQKACDLGYPHELWTTRLLARHGREHAVAAGHPSLARIVQGTVCKILAAHEIKPHKIRYYLERRDDDFDAKMAEVLCVYREVAVFKESDTTVTGVAIISYDEKPGIRRSATPPPTCRHGAARSRHERAITNTRVTARSVCWLASTCSPVVCMPVSKTAIARASSSLFSSNSMPPIHRRPPSN